MQSTDDKLAQLIADATAALEQERRVAEEADELLLRQIQAALTMEQKQKWFKTWLSDRLPARFLEVFQVDYRAVADNGGYWYAQFVYRENEYHIYINGSLGVSLYAPRINSPSVHELILELDGRTSAERAGLRLLAAVGTRASTLDNTSAEVV
ncbi:MAG: hypothetical protein L0Z53_24780 [Acidobacteriales bacterium]|nr:hypothetical protein [Terriglobales bacterium]